MRRAILTLGSTAAGLAAALQLGRQRRSVIVVDAGEPRNRPAAHMHSFLSREGQPPGEFLAVGTVGGGCGLELDRWIKPGDVVELEAAGIGVLRNPIGAKEEVPPGAGLASYTGSPRVSPHH